MAAMPLRYYYKTNIYSIFTVSLSVTVGWLLEMAAGIPKVFVFLWHVGSPVNNRTTVYTIR
jgi:hypothetical protein